jgi:hypothetical protein
MRCKALTEPTCSLAPPPQVWVPSRFNALTFAQAGVNPERLQVLAEPVDTALFSPQSAMLATAVAAGAAVVVHPILSLLPELTVRPPLFGAVFIRRRSLCQARLGTTITKFEN